MTNCSTPAQTTDLSWLPSDADEQLSLSFRIISNAYRTRVTTLEADARAAKAELSQKSEQLTLLQKKSSALEVQLIESGQRGNQLAEENKQLITSVQKLQRDNNRLESLKKAVLHSIQDDQPGDEAGHQWFNNDDTLQKSAPRTINDLGSGNTMSHDLFPLNWNTNNDGCSPNVMSSGNSKGATLNPPTSARSVDGKAFFRSAREVLSSEQFNLFLGNIKKLNHHQITREEALKQAQHIFGDSNTELFSDFKTMLTR